MAKTKQLYKKLKSKRFKKDVRDFVHRTAVILTILLLWASAAIIKYYSGLPDFITNTFVVSLFVLGLIQLVVNLRSPE